MKVDTTAKELLFSTVRIVNQGHRGTSVGTGFLMTKQVDENRHAPLLVTNKHVLEGAVRLTIGAIAKDPLTGDPRLGQAENFVLVNPQWVGHPDPDVDVAVMGMVPLFQASERLFFKSIPTTLMPSSSDDLFFDAIEEITFIGYPNGQQDPAHLTPIVRRGTTVTPLELPFAGKPSFLVDGSVFGGSSGSPVFLLNEGVFRTGPLSTQIGNRTVLIGVVAATLVRNQDHPIVVGHGPHIKIAQELNLGVVYSWHAIEQTIDAALGGTVTAITGEDLAAATE
ncbi:trypsin-like peptidase domain-containing protein [Streptomyces sp. NPDC087270]|uniref:trypsin-like peptidase domain-containing protein n=1 Tax=Streptomyces sp. NPDC087270 TaxID=3365774 RepID=UPI00382884B5